MKIYTIHNVNTLLRAIDKLKKDIDISKEWMITLKRKRRKRNCPQNALYHVWIKALSIEKGYEKEELHDAVKRLFIGEKNVVLFGVSQKVAISTTTLNTKEFSRLLDNVYSLAIDNNVNLLRPEDRLFPEFCEYYKNYYK